MIYRSSDNTVSVFQYFLSLRKFELSFSILKNKFRFLITITPWKYSIRKPINIVIHWIKRRTGLSMKDKIVFNLIECGEKTNQNHAPFPFKRSIIWSWKLNWIWQSIIFHLKHNIRIMWLEKTWDLGRGRNYIIFMTFNFDLKWRNEWLYDSRNITKQAWGRTEEPPRRPNLVNIKKLSEILLHVKLRKIYTYSFDRLPINIHIRREWVNGWMDELRKQKTQLSLGSVFTTFFLYIILFGWWSFRELILCTIKFMF